MDDPFSTAIRKYIPWPEYQTLEGEVSCETLIVQKNACEGEVRFRIDRLQTYENELGFVFLGEKQWLESRLTWNFELTYELWVQVQLSNVVFPEGLQFKEESDGLYWEGYTEEMHLFALFPELTPYSIQIDNLLVRIPGSAEQPESWQLWHAFEVLHNIAYYLHLAGERYRGKKIFVDEIVFANQEGLWRMDLINEYGSVGQVIFVNRGIIS